MAWSALGLGHDVTRSFEVPIKLIVRDHSGRNLPTMSYNILIDTEATRIELDNAVAKKLSNLSLLTFELKWKNAEGMLEELDDQLFNHLMSTSRSHSLTGGGRAPLSQTDCNNTQSSFISTPLKGSSSSRSDELQIECVLMPSIAATTMAPPLVQQPATVVRPLLGLTAELLEANNHQLSRLASSSSSSPPLPTTPPCQDNITVPIRKIEAVTSDLVACTFRVRALVRAVRTAGYDNFKKTMTIAVLEEPGNPASSITAKGFTEGAASASVRLRQMVGAEVILGNLQVQGKTERDRQFQDNTHPCILIIKDNATVELVRSAHEAAVDTRSNSNGGAILSFGNATGPGSSSAVTPSSGSSNAPQMATGAKKTIFKPRSAAAPPPAPMSASGSVGVASSGMMMGGSAVPRQRDTLTGKVNNGSGPVTNDDVRRRDEQLVVTRKRVRQLQQSAQAKDVDPRCFFCRLDLTNPSGIRQLKARAKLLADKGFKIALDLSDEEAIQSAFGDHRRRDPLDRTLCANSLFDMHTATEFAVHPRCAHICYRYQQGDDASDLQTGLCFLCRQSGAITMCYFPECGRLFHTECAILLPNHCPMGQHASAAPVPSCSAHAWVDTKREAGDKKLPNAKQHDDKRVLFDSSKPKDIRDPDEDD